MSKVPQHLIEEATRRGIVPGARINCAYGRGEGTVAPYIMWHNFGTSLWCGSDDFGNSLRAYSCGKWATVIGTAQSVATPSEGLKDGDAVDCGPAMRAGIIELAKAMGFTTRGIDPLSSWPTGIRVDSGQVIVTNACDLVKYNHTPEAFIAKMRVTAAQPKPIKIGDHNVEFSSGSIKVGCTTIDNATVRSIADKLKD